MRSVLPAIRAAMEDHFAVPVTGIERLWSGTTGVHARATTTSGAVFAKTYPLRADFPYEQLNVDIVRGWASTPIPTAAPLPTTGGAWIHQQPGLALSVWQWADGAPARTLTAGQAAAIGKTLAHLHRHLDRLTLPTLPVNAEQHRTRPADQIRERFQRLLAELRLPPHHAAKAATLEQVRRRLDQLRHLEDLRDGLTPAQLGRVHGDVASPNLLFHGETLTAVLDPRIQIADRARELGRIAFDPHTVAADDTWPATALACVSAYVAADGPILAAEIAFCARLALLHAMTSTYPLADILTGRQAAKVRAQQHRYWSDRAITVDRLLAALPDLERQLPAVTERAQQSAPAAGGRS